MLIADEITANGRAELRTINTLYNRGMLQAGDLHVQSKQIYNDENGVLYGNRNSVIADHRIENYGIIYGDKLSLSADTLSNREENNQAAVIAARERLDIGVKDKHLPFFCYTK